MSNILGAYHFVKQCFLYAHNAVIFYSPRPAWCRWVSWIRALLFVQDASAAQISQPDSRLERVRLDNIKKDLRTLQAYSVIN